MEELLSKLISFPTITSDRNTNLECLQWIQKYLGEQGVSSSIIEVNHQWLLHFGADLKNARIMINTHLDVVPAPEHLFTAHKAGDRLIGRGASDTKAWVAIMLSLGKDLIEKAAMKDVLFCIVTDEEIGGFSTKSFLDQLPKLEFGLFGEPTNLNVVNKAKGVMQVKLVIKGRSSHGSRPWEGENVIEKFAESLTAFKKTFAQSELTFDTTYNFSKVSAGTAINQIPDSLESWVDIRFSPDDDPEVVLNNLQKSFGDCELEVILNESPILTSSENSYFKQFLGEVKKVSPDSQLQMDHGSSDARHCTAKGIPSAIFGPIGGDLHSNNEWVDVESIDKTKKIVERYLRSLE